MDEQNDDDELPLTEVDTHRTPAAKSLTLSSTRVSVRRLTVLGQQYPEQPGVDYQRPTTRADCEPGGPLHIRPCPFVSCKYHLYLDVNAETGALALNHPTLEPWELEHSCALDVADEGGTHLADIGAAIGVTRERIRQIEITALAAIAVNVAVAIEGDADSPRVEEARRLADAALQLRVRSMRSLRDHAARKRGRDR